jgi:hypothetical protein
MAMAFLFLAFFHERDVSSSLVLWLLWLHHRQVIEGGEAVGLGPEAHFALRIRGIMNLDELLAIKIANNVVAPGHHPQSVPLAGSHLHLGSGKLFAAAIPRPVSIRARHMACLIKFLGFIFIFSVRV